MLGDSDGLWGQGCKHSFFSYFRFLQTTALKNGSLRHDIHYWIGKDTSQVFSHFIW
jgi:hypothetical protein